MYVLHTVAVAQEVFHLLKRMHRAARIPDDDAEALQIGAWSILFNCWRAVAHLGKTGI